MSYLVQCWNCLGEFDALEAVWCGDSSTHPTKICPFCLQCFCAAAEAYKEQFWAGAPDSLVQDIKTLNESRQRLGDLLVRSRVITHEDLLGALEEQKKTRKRLGEILLGMGKVERGVLDDYLGRQQSVITADLARAAIRPELIKEVGVELCYERKVLPLARDQVGDRSHLTLAMANPSDGRTVDEVQRKTGCRVIAEAASESEILDLLRDLFPRSAGAASEESAADTRKQVLELLQAAVRRRASHVHLEASQTELLVFFRIDGSLYRVKKLPKRILPLVLQVFRELLHQPPGAPFDHGRTFLQIGDGRYAVLVTCQEGEQGENLLVRLLDVDRFGGSLPDAMGDPVSARALESALAARRGLVLVTSPLFHGRRESLYAAVRTLRSAGRAPLFLEALLACPVRDVVQKETTKEELAKRLPGLASAPPSALALNDLLDASTMRGVIEVAGVTLVVASMRANGIAHALMTLSEWGVSGLELSEVLRLVTNQRQVRRLCPECSAPDAASRSTAFLGLSGEQLRALQPRRSAGCPACQRLGSVGRVAISEAMVVDDRLRALIAAEPAPELVYTTAIEHGTVPLRRAFLERVREGAIALEELEKVAV